MSADLTPEEKAMQAYIVSCFPSQERGGKFPLIVPPSMLDEARAAAPDAWIETYDLGGIAPGHRR